MPLKRIVVVSLLLAVALAGCSRPIGESPKLNRFVSQSEFESNLAKQRAMSPETVAQLRKYGVTDDSALRLEYFFYTNRESNAAGLESALKQLGYDVESGETAANDGTILVTGWTAPIKMDESSVVQWTDDMCRIGFTHDCDFDGWGTNPSQ